MTSSTRKRGSLATLVVMVVLWGLDLLTSASPPQSASAEQHPTAAAQAGAPSGPTPAPSDLGQILGALTMSARRPAPPGDGARDLFVASEDFLERLRPKAAKAVEIPVEAPPVEPEAPPEPEFPPTHELRGIVWGPRPMAIIDGEPVGQGAEISGYRIVEIGRDFVELQRASKRVRLALGPPKSRARN